MLFGAININKPHGMTSHDVIGKLRKIMNMKKIGHAGTLDPFATGVLPVCIGKATKLIQYLDKPKSYRACVLLGKKTDSYDLEGEIIQEKPVNLESYDINAVLDDFRGNIEQTPPLYSAVHYKGKRLYEYARNNIEVEDIPKRKVVIDKIELVQIQRRTNPVLEIDIDCSEGTYIRSIAYDIGETLGCGACLSDLVRTKSSGMLIENSYTLEEIAKMKEQDDFSFLINPVDIISLDLIELNNDELEKIKLGQFIRKQHSFKNDEKIKLVSENNLVAIAKIDGNLIKPANVFV